MQDLFVMHEEIISLVDIDGADSSTIRIPMELDGVIKEELIMIMNREAITGGGGGIEGYTFNVMFLTDPNQVSHLSSDAESFIRITDGIFNRGTSGSYTDIQFTPDNLDIEVLINGVGAEDYVVAHRKTYRKYQAGEDILLQLHAQPMDETGLNTVFNAAGDAVRLFYVARYGVFC